MNPKEFLKLQKVKGELIKRIAYDPSTGALTHKKRNSEAFNRKYSGKGIRIVVTFRNGYWHSKTDFILFGRRLQIIRSRLCWLLHTGDWPEHTIDHINRDSLDDRWGNLRDITIAENNKNRGPRMGRRYKGYSTYHGRFYASIFYQGQSFHLGVFDTEVEAAKAYDKKAYELHGDASRLNFPEDYS